MAERDVAIWPAVENALIRVRKDPWVVVGGAVAEQDDVAGGDRLAVDVEVVCRVSGRRPGPAR